MANAESYRYRYKVAKKGVIADCIVWEDWIKISGDDIQNDNFVVFIYSRFPPCASFNEGTKRKRVTWS